MAKDDQFIILRNGLQSAQTIQLEDGRNAEEVSRSISFDWYEAIFKYLGNKTVKVVSSMGEQSCGKSYLLNHFIGTSFDGSAMVSKYGVSKLHATDGNLMAYFVSALYRRRVDVSR